VEKDGTFVNCQGRVQRIGRAFPPLGGSREDWRILLDLARKLGLRLDWRGPEEIFEELAKVLPPFKSLSYETIGAQGAGVVTAKPPSGTAAP
jgi:predicted molibdopterin-dependent oxidoreductase YjgC